MGRSFTGQGKAIGAVASKDVRVLVVGNPCNTNCLIAMHSAAGVPKDRFTAMTMLDQNRAAAQLAAKAGVHHTEVSRMIIWGNHSNTQFPDWTNARIGGKPAGEVIGDQGWLKDVFIKTVQERGKAIIEARGKSSAMSAASAAIDHARALYQVHDDNDPVSLCVPSNGQYGVPEGIISSFPCATDGQGNWRIVEGFELDDYAQSLLKKTTDELLGERDAVKDLLPS